MSNDVYKKLARVLDTLPNGYPATDDGVELLLLKKIFAPDKECGRHRGIDFSEFT